MAIHETVRQLKPCNLFSQLQNFSTTLRKYAGRLLQSRFSGGGTMRCRASCNHALQARGDAALCAFSSSVQGSPPSPEFPRFADAIRHVGKASTRTGQACSPQHRPRTNGTKPRHDVHPLTMRHSPPVSREQKWPWKTVKIETMSVGFLPCTLHVLYIVYGEARALVAGAVS